jgi:hypothetical protein
MKTKSYLIQKVKRTEISVLFLTPLKAGEIIDKNL